MLIKHPWPALDADNEAIEEEKSDRIDHLLFFRYHRLRQHQ